MADKIFSVLIMVVAVLALLVGVWIAFFAPCKSIGWVPIREMPSRCISVVK